MYNTIYNPYTKQYIYIFSSEGKYILNNYINQIGGKPCRQKINRTIKLRSDNKKLDLKNFPCFSPRGTKTSHIKFMKKGSEKLLVDIDILKNSILDDISKNINVGNFKDIFIYDLLVKEGDKIDEDKIDEQELYKRISMISDEFINKYSEIISNKDNYVFDNLKIDLDERNLNITPYLKILFNNNIKIYFSDIINSKKLVKLQNNYRNISRINDLNKIYNKNIRNTSLDIHKADRQLILKWINIAFGYIPDEINDQHLMEKYIYDFVNVVSLYYYYKNRAGIRSNKNYIKYKKKLEDFDNDNSFNIWLNN